MTLSRRDIRSQGQLLQECVGRPPISDPYSYQSRSQTVLQTKLQELQDTAFESDLALQEVVNYRKSKYAPTTLHLIALHENGDRSDAIEQLVELGADLNAVANLNDVKEGPRKQCTPLHIAAHKLNIDLVRGLLEAGADPNLQDGIGKTPLHYLLEKNFRLDSRAEEFYALFQEYNIDPWVVDNSGVSAIELAIENGSGEILDQPFDLRESSKWIANKVARKVFPKYLVDLIQNEDDFNLEEVFSFLAREIRNGNKAVKKLVSEVISYRDAEGWGVLHHAANASAHLNITESLLRFNVDVNSSSITTSGSQGMSPLHIAALSNNIDCMEALLERGADPNQKDAMGRTVLDLLHLSSDSHLEESFDLITSAGGICISTAKKLVPDLKRGLRNADVETVEEQLRKGATSDHLNAKDIANIIKSLQARIVRSCANRQWDEVWGVAEVLEVLSKKNQPKFTKLVSDVVNVSDEKKGASAFAACLEGRAPMKLLRKLLELGVDTNWRDEAGQNYGFYIHDLSSTDGMAIARLLNEAGVDFNQARSDGHTIASFQVMNYGLASVEFSRQLGAELPEDPIAKDLMARLLGEQLLEPLSKDLSKLSERRELQARFSRYLSAIKEARKLIGDDIATALINPDQGDSPLTLAVEHSLPGKFLDRLVSLGADLNYQRSVEDREFVSSERMPLEVAFTKGNRRRVQKLVELGANPNWQDAAGRSYLMRALDVSGTEPLQQDALELVVSTGIDLNLVDSKGSSALHYSLERGSFDNALFLQAQGAFLYPTRQGITYEVYAGEVTENVTADEILQRTLDKVSRFPTAIQKEAASIYRKSRSLKQLYHYVQSYDEVSRVSLTSDGREFNQLVPNILFTHGVKSMNELIKHIERTVKKDWPFSGYHPLEAEMLLLLNQPSESDPDMKNVKGIIACLDATRSSRNKFTARSLTNLARIGSLTFSFPFWRYDAMSIREKQEDGSVNTLAPTLLEQFGFERIAERDTDWKLLPGNERQHLYGPGFMLSESRRNFEYPGITYNTRNKTYTFDQKTYLEFRRAYLAVSNPEHGTLIIRNSSHKFGRDALGHTAYYSPHAIGEGLTQEDLHNFNPILLERAFVDIVGSYDHASSVNNHDKHLEFLLREMVAVKDAYRSWKFDTSLRTAWQDVLDTGKKELVGGQYSSGFRSFVSIVQYVSDYQSALSGDEQIQYPSLAFVNPDYPMWKTYGYTDGEDRESVQLTLDPETVSILKKVADCTVTDEELDSSGIRNFFSQAGFQNEAELVLINND